MSDAFRVGVCALALCAAGAAVSQDEVPEADPVEEAQPTSFFQGWDGNISFGLFGSDGNTERLNLRGQVDGERETDKTVTTFNTWYSYAKDDGNESENKARAVGRNDWKIPDSQWFAFVEGVFDYDEFQSWDTRASIFAGPGYVWFDDEKQTLKTRAGLGATREFGSGDNAFRAEGLLAAEYRRQLTERQTFTASAEAIPDLGDNRNWRILARAMWEVVVDPEVNMTLRAGVEDRYDTDPDGARRNDVDFFVLLGWEY